MTTSGHMLPSGAGRLSYRSDCSVPFSRQLSPVTQPTLPVSESNCCSTSASNTCTTKLLGRGSSTGTSAQAPPIVGTLRTIVSRRRPVSAILRERPGAVLAAPRSRRRSFTKSRLAAACRGDRRGPRSRADARRNSAVYAKSGSRVPAVTDRPSIRWAAATGTGPRRRLSPQRTTPDRASQIARPARLIPSTHSTMSSSKRTSLFDSAATRSSGHSPPAAVGTTSERSGRPMRSGCPARASLGGDSAREVSAGAIASAHLNPAAGVSVLAVGLLTTLRKSPPGPNTHRGRASTLLLYAIVTASLRNRTGNTNRYAPA